MASCFKLVRFEDTKQSCYFDKHLQEKCHQKTKVEMILFSGLTDKNKTGRVGSPMTEDCNNNFQIPSTVLLFFEKTANVATSTLKTN